MTGVCVNVFLLHLLKQPLQTDGQTDRHTYIHTLLHSNAHIFEYKPLGNLNIWKT